jgi:hypothetical protein
MDELDQVDWVDESLKLLPMQPHLSFMGLYIQFSKNNTCC